MRKSDISRVAKTLRKSSLSYVNRALIAAAKAGNLLRVYALIDVGAEVNHRDPYGRTAIMFAALRRDRVMMIRLQKLGADTAMRDYQGHSLEYYENPPPRIDGLTEEELTSIIASSVIRAKTPGNAELAVKSTSKPKRSRRI